jgi:hypothetical protein
MNFKFDKNYYLKVIDTYKFSLENSKQISAFNKKDPIETQKKQVKRIKLSFGVIHSYILFSMYSARFSKEEMVSQYLLTLDLIYDNWDASVVKMHIGRKQQEIDVYLLNYHILIRWLLSFGILLNIPNSSLNKLAYLIKRDNIKDALYDFLISSFVNDWSITNEMSIKSPKNKIIDIIFEKNKVKCQKMIKTYLEKSWYKTYKNQYGWYDSHKLPKEKYAHTGYWAFEIAAIVKIKQLDDSSFRDNVYYPKDLV